MRRLFRPQQPRLLPLGCTTGDAADRAGVEAMARALARAGRRPLLVDLLGGAARRDDDTSFAHIDAGALLPEGAGVRELARFVASLTQPGDDGRGAFDVALVAADPLRLADLTAGVAERIVLVARTRGDGLARTYSQIKAMHLAHGFRAYCALFFDAGSRAAALASHRRLADTAARFLGAAIEFGGTREAIDAERFADEALRWSQPIVARPRAATH
ncbi:MAG: hypothetical protein LT102_15335 [Burkholderiaceae bacterium]|nr:hypothetical protein [Burkholderiaceae bacterium]